VLVLLAAVVAALARTTAPAGAAAETGPAEGGREAVAA
jgi:hypothetical protein